MKKELENFIIESDIQLEYFEEVVKLDTKYISEWNLGLDLKILCKTIGVVFKKEGSM